MLGTRLFINKIIIYSYFVNNRKTNLLNLKQIVCKPTLSY